MITIDKIKEGFLSEAIEHGKAIAIGDNKKANKLHKKLHNLYSKAKKQNVVNVFEEFLNEDDENVRFWAATFSLSSSPELAEKSLAKLTELSSITGLSAKTTLHLWKEGKLNLL
ncbi:hypothetical protein [Tenacibaculum sp. C7A-26P2]|uniref:hypothetical protein n=1 Tax=Tenacibaculum sp. C7A-26P2 TaxID=3447504 RepID=UPI003F8265D7